MTVERHKITEKIFLIADKYGSRNKQQLKQLEFFLNKIDETELFFGLYNVFLETSENYFERQQLAGTFLFSLKPRVEQDPKLLIKNSLNTFNLSVEELPWYFRDVYGKPKTIEILNELENEDLNESEKTSLRVYKFWLGEREDS